MAGLEPDANECRELDGSGLYFRVKPDGQKSWQLRYKKPDGKWSWLGLGGYPEVSGSVAGQKAAELRADGKKPIVTKQARKKAERDIAGETFEPLAREWYTSRLTNWNEGSAKRIIGALERHVFQVFGKRQSPTRYQKLWGAGHWLPPKAGVLTGNLVIRKTNPRRCCVKRYTNL